MWRLAASRGLRTNGIQSLTKSLKYSTAVTPSGSAVEGGDPFKVLNVLEDATRDDLRNQFFELCKTNHPALTGDQAGFDKILEAYETAIKIVDEKSPIQPWDGISAMNYAQAWEGKDHWRKLWEEHWATRLAHMYKHNQEITDLNANLKWREAQYIQIRDWLVLAKSVMPADMRAKWLEACDQCQATMLWARTNKQNYKRYYISNQNSTVAMQKVYGEHEYWRNYENLNWAEWDSFFAQASAWAAEHENEIKLANNTVGPLAHKFEYLFRGRLTYASMDPEEKAALVASQEKEWSRAFWKAEAFKVIRWAVVSLERLVRGSIPAVVLIILYGWYTEFQPFISFLDVSATDGGAVKAVSKKADLVEWVVAGAPTIDPKGP